MPGDLRVRGSVVVPEAELPPQANGAGHEPDAAVEVAAETAEPGELAPAVAETQPEDDGEDRPQRQGWWSRWVR